jgi:hypothetical protein
VCCPHSHYPSQRGSDYFEIVGTLYQGLMDDVEDLDGVVGGGSDDLQDFSWSNFVDFGKNLKSGLKNCWHDESHLPLK